jgi:hypothetical protein
MGLGYLLMLASRRRSTRPSASPVARRLGRGAWLARVSWPFAGSRGFEPGRVDVAWDSRPATWVLVLAGAAVLSLIFALRGAAIRGWMRPRRPRR